MRGTHRDSQVLLMLIYQTGQTGSIEEVSVPGYAGMHASVACGNALFMLTDDDGNELNPAALLSFPRPFLGFGTSRHFEHL